MSVGFLVAKRLAPRCLTIALACTACQGEPPRELRLELPELITSKEPVLLHVRGVQQDGTAREIADFSAKITPPDLASLGKAGVFTCDHSGDGNVQVSVGSVQATAKFACKLAARLEVPEKLSIDLSGGDVDPHIKVLDSASRELDLPVTLTSNMGSVVSSRSGQLVPGKVGTATITARAGALTKQIAIEVVRTLKPEVLPIDSNRRISYSLDAGKYRLSIVLPSPHRVQVTWLGAPYCAYTGDGAKHDVDCTLANKGSVSFDNPAFLLRGEKTASIEGVTLREIP